MVTLIDITRAGVLILSLLGHMLFLHWKTGMKTFHIPLFCISALTLTVYLFGIVGQLEAGTYFTLFTGLIAALVTGIEIARKRYSPKSFFRSPSTVAFLLLCAYFVLRMRGGLYLHVDNFSHWGVIVREMCLTDSFPTEGTAVTFLNYTPGSASFIYFICNFLGYSEGVALASQGIILAACIAVFFGDIKWREPLSVASVGVVSVISLAIPELESASLHIYSLTVDGLIAYLMVASLLIVYQCKDSLLRCLVTLTPVISMLSVVKASARLFALLAVAAVAILFWRRIFSGGALARPSTYLRAGGIALAAGITVCVPSLYNFYISRTFSPESLRSSKFPSTVDGAIHSICSRDEDFLRDIAGKVTAAVFDPSSPYTVIIIVSVLAALLTLTLTLILRKSPRTVLVSILTAAAFFVIYTAEIYVLYLFIFPENEAVILASFYRYFSTGAVIISSLLLLGIVFEMRELLCGVQHRKLILAASVAALIIPGIPAVENAIQFIRPDYREETAKRIEERAEFHAFYAPLSDRLPKNSSVTVFTDDTSFFSAILPGYELLTCRYSVIKVTKLSDHDSLKQKLEGADYLIISGNGDELRKTLTSLGYSDPGVGVIFKILHTESGTFFIDTEG